MGMNIRCSAHAEQRIDERLSNIITYNDVMNKINKVKARIVDHRTYVLIKRMPYIEIADADVKPDGIARGDMVIALVEDGIVESVILRKSWSLSAEYKKILH
jgi:hypothetical protein